ncbi:DUF1415 domain-containing protein [Aquabacterium sp.]|uniref:DUF1415 domain-containing protein n=1 Tax=Aquabacterium sp. TaxID=1872578 RepID=UPI002D1A9366|nr:DUF1415 domain-containing protein [Aquabacterium sp.]HSW06403.1 DUF1415 domain-containing protein [Aquabacterium sp.]
MQTERVIAETRAWLDRAVIGLNLCPFAKAVQAKGQVRYIVSDAADVETLQAHLAQAMQELVATDPEVTDTVLLIHPQVLQDFEEFNEFLGIAEDTLAALDLEGVLQVAHFHPQFQFADAAPGDISHATNQSPYPTLHLLREDSIDRAVEAFPEPEAIYEANITTMEGLGAAGWAALQAQWQADAEAALAAAKGAPPST